MGLGKTVQTLATLKGKSLVVVPTSLLLNWKNEAQRFRPDLRTLIYHGSERTWDNTASLILTTYSILRLEADRFASMNWSTVILDEAHLIRNPETQAAIAVTKLNASFRLALTGTPIQNRKRDLLSLFQFVAPDLFFNEEELQSKVIAPFFLRRTKEQVLKELPPKTHIDHTLQLQPDEQRLYDSVFAAAKSELLSRLDSNEELSPFTFFEMLLRARQACNHASLLNPEQSDRASTKLTAILNLIDELVDAGHSVLVYSQWTRFLDRIESSLTGKTPFERLDGSTQNRGEIVNRFQSENGAKVFLLSLQAGGVGLNLTRASHVIFCDPWWNPFVELQAEDRAYRMGQEKPVTIHRMLMEGTLEMDIRSLQKEKLKLGEETFGVEELKKSILN
jgi:SNF2 family DNA or RNA helicase